MSNIRHQSTPSAVAPSLDARPAPPSAAASSTVAGLAGARRALFVAGSGADIARRHARLIAGLVARRHQVLCLAPRLDTAASAALTAAGAVVQPWPARESFLRALAERQGASALKAIVADWQPHVALVEASALMLPALAAARAAGVPRVLALVDGLDELASPKPDLKRWRRAFESIDGAIVTNTDEARALTATGMTGQAWAPQLVPTGIDLAEHLQQPLPGLGAGLVFAMIAPLEARHGVAEFLEAASMVAAQAPTARFLLAGALPAGDEASAEQAMSRAITAHAGTVQYLGAPPDIRSVLSRAHVVVYPARVGGTPHSVHEALAAGRPVIVSNTPGCRDTVDERVNGCLVQPGDTAALAEAMTSFLRRPDLIPSMARAARSKAERRFDGRAAAARMDELLGLG